MQSATVETNLPTTHSKLTSVTLLVSATNFDASAIACSGVQRAARNLFKSPELAGSTNSTGGSGEVLRGKARTLDGQGLAHNRAAAGNDLQVGHGATTRPGAGSGH